MRSENRPEVALMSHMAGISNKNGLYNLLSYAKYSQMPLRNTLHCNVIEIVISYLDGVREKDVSKWHLEQKLKIIAWNRHCQDQLPDFCIFKSGA